MYKGVINLDDVLHAEIVGDYILSIHTFVEDENFPDTERLAEEEFGRDRINTSGIGSKTNKTGTKGD